MLKRNIQLKTLIARLDQYLKDRMSKLAPMNIVDLRSTLLIHINQFMAENVNRDFSIRFDGIDTSLVYTPENLVLAELDLRTDKDRKNGLYRYKRIIHTGPGFETGLQDLIERRKHGMSLKAEDSLYEIRHAGYDNPEDLTTAYEQAKKTVDDLQFIKWRYERLDDQEKQAIREILAKTKGESQP